MIPGIASQLRARVRSLSMVFVPAVRRGRRFEQSGFTETSWRITVLLRSSDVSPACSRSSYRPALASHVPLLRSNP